MEIAEIGRAALMERIGNNVEPLEMGKMYRLHSSKIMSEGVHFDLTYFPMQHLGIKAIVNAIDGIIAHNGICRRVVVSLGISARFSVEDIEALFEGFQHGCHIYGVELETGDVTASVNGLIISVTAFGEVERERYVALSNARENDLVCITGSLGAAYMGLQLLEREKRVFAGNDNPEPAFAGHEELLRAVLVPHSRVDIIDSLAENNLLPSAMAVINDGLAAEALAMCRESGCGMRLYLERIPISRATHQMAEELNADPVVAALNGGDDHEILFTLPLSARDEISKIGGVDIIGHITTAGAGAYLVLPDGNEIAITAPNY